MLFLKLYHHTKQSNLFVDHTIHSNQSFEVTLVLNFVLKFYPLQSVHKSICNSTPKNFSCTNKCNQTKCSCFHYFVIKLKCYSGDFENPKLFHCFLCLNTMRLSDIWRQTGACLSARLFIERKVSERFVVPIERRLHCMTIARCCVFVALISLWTS